MIDLLPSITISYVPVMHANQPTQTHHPQVELNGPFAQQLGLKIGAQGDIEVSPPFNQTSVPGVFAAGDAATPMRAALNAISMGALTAVGLVQQLQAENALKED